MSTKLSVTVRRENGSAWPSRATCGAIVLALAVACSRSPGQKSGGPAGASPEAAAAFVGRASGELDTLDRRETLAGFMNGVDGTPEHEKALEQAQLEVSRAKVALWKQADKFARTPVDPLTARQLQRIRIPPALPAPFDETAAKELFSLQTTLTRNYTDAQDCVGRANCRPKDKLYDILEGSRRPAELLSAWREWHDAAAVIRAPYTRSVELLNAGARDFGHPDAGATLRAQYEMPPAEFAAEYERLWDQMRPLYEALHCHVRAKLHEHYPDLVSETGLIPAHLLGNMWGQFWGGIDGLLDIPQGAAPIDVTKALQSRKVTPVEMVRTGETFFRSLGFEPLPEKFWAESVLAPVKGRKTDCHASAWPIDPARSDVRLKMCVEIKEEDFRTVHHELGHIYYYLAYAQQPPLFREGANPGFHEAVGDTLALSITPTYLASIGLAREDVRSSDLAYLLRVALGAVPALAMSVVVDEWRWKVFSGQISPDRYNAGWWDQVRRYQGFSAPLPRSERDFDAGMFYHVSYGVPYDRYFVATLLQFDFHRALCNAAGYKGPLHRCSIYGSRAAGERLQNALKLGASARWQDALEQLTGSQTIDGSAMAEYFAPVAEWLTKQNAGRQCGWE